MIFFLNGRKLFYQSALWKGYLCLWLTRKERERRRLKGKIFPAFFLSLSLLSAEKQHWTEEADQLHFKNIYAVIKVWASIQKDFYGSPNLGDCAYGQSPHPAQLGPGKVAAGSPLAHVAQLRLVSKVRRSAKVLLNRRQPPDRPRSWKTYEGKSI